MSTDKTRPNVLFVMVDQWPGKLMGAAGHRQVLTPTLDQLARLGTRFSRAYSECPICIPARRTIMTGTSPRTHGDRNFAPAAHMPDLPTLAQSFRNGGYQAYAVGKMHVYPQRDRIGFDDILLAEEGRPQLGAVDDYDMYLADQGAAGEQFMHGMNNNDYLHREWHLAERLHVTNWTTREAARMIKRRDPTRPAFWHVSYTHPHPPLVPLRAYLDLYDAAQLDLPITGEWAGQALPPALQSNRDHWAVAPDEQTLRRIRRAFYALCTHIDPQEQRDVSESPDYADVRCALEASLVEQAWGVDESWITDGRLTGAPADGYRFRADPHLGGQRGMHYPHPRWITPPASSARRVDSV